MIANINTLLAEEEGWSSTPYLCSESYPTVGLGIKIGPKCTLAELRKYYQFTLPRAVGDLWFETLIQEVYDAMVKRPNIAAAIKAMELTGVGWRNNARICVLVSMAYQMGVDGLDKFVNTLAAMARADWPAACAGMLASKWAKQTPNRADRHAKQMGTGVWLPDYQQP